MNKKELFDAINESQEQYALSGYYDDNVKLRRDQRVLPTVLSVGDAVDWLLIGIIEREDIEQASSDLVYAINQLQSALKTITQCREREYTELEAE